MGMLNCTKKSNNAAEMIIFLLCMVSSCGLRFWFILFVSFRLNNPFTGFYDQNIMVNNSIDLHTLGYRGIAQLGSAHPWGG